MTQKTGAAFQALVSLNEQATDPTSHTPVRRIYTLWEVLRHLLKSHGRPLWELPYGYSYMGTLTLMGTPAAGEIISP